MPYKRYRINDIISAELFYGRLNLSLANDTAKEKLPEEIVLSMKILWDRVMTQAEEKLVIATQDFEQSTAELKENYNKQREESVHWHQQYNEMKQEKDQPTQQLKQELIMLRKEKTLLENELAREKLERNTLQTQHDRLVSQSDIIKSDLNQFQKEAIKHAHSEQHWQAQYQKNQTKLDEQQTLIINFTTEIAVLSQKYSDAQGMLKEIGDQNKFLAHEKWVLAQENAQLVGQLKQFEKLGI